MRRNRRQIWIQMCLDAFPPWNADCKGSILELLNAAAITTEQRELEGIYHKTELHFAECLLWQAISKSRNEIKTNSNLIWSCSKWHHGFNFKGLKAQSWIVLSPHYLPHTWPTDKVRGEVSMKCDRQSQGPCEMFTFKLSGDAFIHTDIKIRKIVNMGVTIHRYGSIWLTTWCIEYLHKISAYHWYSKCFDCYCETSSIPIENPSIHAGIQECSQLSWNLDPGEYSVKAFKSDLALNDHTAG